MGGLNGALRPPHFPVLAVELDGRQRVLPDECFDCGLLLLSDALEEVLRSLRILSRHSEHPNLRTVRSGEPADVSQVAEENARCTHGVVAFALGDDEREVGLLQHRKFLRKREHRAVVRNESVPRPCIAMKGAQELPIVDVGELLIDLADRDELCIGDGSA
jgi:hypothetical protein